MWGLRPVLPLRGKIVFGQIQSFRTADAPISEYEGCVCDPSVCIEIFSMKYWPHDIPGGCWNVSVAQSVLRKLCDHDLQDEVFPSVCTPNQKTCVYSLCTTLIVKLLYNLLYGLRHASSDLHAYGNSPITSLSLIQFQ